MVAAPGAEVAQKAVQIRLRLRIVHNPVRQDGRTTLRIPYGRNVT